MLNSKVLVSYVAQSISMKLGYLNRKNVSKCNRAVHTVQFIHLLYIIIDRIQGRELPVLIFADTG